jgi:hypothetical protein
MWPFNKREKIEEDAMQLRKDAMKNRILGQFNAAHREYKQADALYKKLGKIDDQCNVLCSIAETTASRDERQECLEKIETLCASIQDPEEKRRALHNLDAMKERLNEHPLR